MSEIEEYFKKLRFDENHHQGLGDIRITRGQQEEIVEMFAQIGIEIERLREIYRRIQAADSPDLKLPVEMSLAMAEMTALLGSE